MLFMGDRNYSGTLVTESMWANSTAKYEGTLYFPKTLLSYGGNPSMSTAKYSLVVAWRVSVQGDSTFNNDFSTLAGGNPIQQVGLIE